jgi:hypothetical protein
MRKNSNYYRTEREIMAVLRHQAPRRAGRLADHFSENRLSAGSLMQSLTGVPICNE